MTVRSKLGNQQDILIVEDSPTQAEILKYLLERNDFKVTVAASGAEALALLETLAPRLVISDIVMPVMDGYELCRQIKSRPRLEGVPVMLVTSLSDVDDVLKGLACGADNFIRKPYDEKYLLSRVEYLLMNGDMRQNKKVQIGMEIYLSGQKHFITAERQQILDLLVSTFEEAVRVKEDLEVRQQELTQAALYDHTYGEVLRLFNSTFDRVQIMQGMLKLMAKHHSYPVSAIYCYDEWNGLYREEASHFGPSAPHITLRMNDDNINQLAAENRLTVLQNPGDHPGIVVDNEADADLFRPECLVICPICHQEKRLAVMIAISGQHLNDRDLTFIEHLAAQLGVALHNREQYEGLRLLTEQLRLRSEEISQKNALLEEANRMKSEFLANMSHELRTPLNAVIGFSEVIRDGLVGPLNEKQQEYITDIFESGRHLLALINDVLDLSKIEAGKMVLEGQETDIAPLLSNSLSIIKEKAAAHRVKLSVNLADDLSKVWLDPRKCKQIVYNLLSNAVKFTPENGKVTLSARIVSSQEALSAKSDMPEIRTMLPSNAGKLLEISVSDTGIGISATDMSRLFQPFVQIDSSLSRRFDGTGLGLVMVKKLADLHGGAVSVSSQPGQGSTFRVWLPYRTTAQAADTEPRDVQLVQEKRKQPSPVKQPLVLIVEDDANAADLIRLQLETEGFRVICAGTGEIALDMLNEGCLPDLITLDILLPGMDGWDFLACLKSVPKLSHIPVVIISIVADDDKGLALGASKVLQKPISSADLGSAISGLGFLRSGAHARVLVIDDDPKAVAIIAAYLEKAGHSVMRAYSGAEGLHLAQSHRPDLIVLDLMMPEVSGFEVAEQLKADPRTAQIPILVLTARHLTAQDRSALNSHVLQVVEKSQFSRGGFISEVHRALGK